MRREFCMYFVVGGSDLCFDQYAFLLLTSYPYSHSRMTAVIQCEGLCEC